MPEITLITIPVSQGLQVGDTFIAFGISWVIEDVSSPYPEWYDDGTDRYNLVVDADCVRQ